MTCLIDRVLGRAGMKSHVYVRFLYIVRYVYTTIQSLEHSPKIIREDFFLKIGILSAKVYTKNVPVASSMPARAELCLSSKSLQYFTNNRVCKVLFPSV